MSRSGKRKPKHGPPYWPCKATGKRGYRDKLDALSVLARSARKGVRRAYRCPECSRWHLTSEAKRGERRLPTRSAGATLRA